METAPLRSASNAHVNSTNVGARLEAITQDRKSELARATISELTPVTYREIQRAIGASHLPVPPTFERKVGLPEFRYGLSLETINVLTPVGIISKTNEAICQQT